ncbi:hypothetical protein GGF42_007362 [Coemansia sp. RSA 2424]|nr:hypothetical protein GGF42_007362 [Coemansia sp. RSA 2424]
MPNVTARTFIELLALGEKIERPTNIDELTVKSSTDGEDWAIRQLDDELNFDPETNAYLMLTDYVPTSSDTNKPMLSAIMDIMYKSAKYMS